MTATTAQIIKQKFKNNCLVLNMTTNFKVIVTFLHHDVFKELQHSVIVILGNSRNSKTRWTVKKWNINIIFNYLLYFSPYLVYGENN
jgi:hypothetical protein